MPDEVITITRYQGAQQARLHSFMQQFVQNIADRSRSYSCLYLRDHDYLEHGLLTNERGSYSLMAAAMDRITPVHQSEMSVNKRVDYRNRANRDLPRERAGRVDLWSYFDGFEYFMEFKRAFVTPKLIRSCAVPKKASGPWNDLLKQITEVKQGVRHNPDYDEYEDRTFFIGMQTITFRLRSKNCKTIKSTHNNQFTQAELRNWTQKLTRKPDAVFAWQITPERHRIRPIAWGDGDKAIKWASYPCHLFCFTIERNHPPRA